MQMLERESKREKNLEARAKELKQKGEQGARGGVHARERRERPQRRRRRRFRATRSRARPRCTDQIDTPRRDDGERDQQLDDLIEAELIEAEAEIVESRRGANDEREEQSRGVVGDVRRSYTPA